MGLFNIFQKSTGKSLCELLHNHCDVSDPQHKAVAQQTIERGLNINDPLAHLACAFAYTYLGATHRKEAISQFEKYLSAPVRSDDFNLWNVYGTLADLYEAELDFANAERFYVLQDTEHSKTVKQNFKAAPPDPMPNIKLGRLYLKCQLIARLNIGNLRHYQMNIANIPRSNK